MVDGISRIYSDQIQPAKPAKTSDKKVPARTDRHQSVERLLPDLKDKVEISAEGRQAAASGAVDAESSVSSEHSEAVSQNWYSAGYKMAVEEAESR